MIKKKDNSSNLSIQDKSAWKKIDSKTKKRIYTFSNDYRAFISTAKTERKAHNEGVRLAKKEGYQDLREWIQAKKLLMPGDKVFYSAAGKTIILAHIGQRDIDQGMRIIGGHTDSPRLDLKARPLYEDGGLALFDTHYYGGIRKYQWVTIPLALHGVVVKKNGDVVNISIGEQTEDPVFVITDLLPHLAKDQAQKKFHEGISGEGLNVICGSIPVADEDAKEGIKLRILKLLNEQYGIDEWDLTSSELELVPAGAARDLGIDRSLILAYGHDDRVCAYTGIRALLDLDDTPEYTAMCILCDKEEIGSVGATGMDSFLFENVTAEIVSLLSKNHSELTLRRCLQRSKMLSADVSALHDPNYPEVSAPNDNMPKLNHGLVISKYGGRAGKAGSNDAHAEYLGKLRQLFDVNDVIWQIGELGKVDQGGGGTIAYMLARYGMDVVDCGIGVLSMHAPMEVAGKLDIYMAYKGFSAFYQL